MNKPRILLGHVANARAYTDEWAAARLYHQRLRDAGFDVEGFCLTLNPPGPALGFRELDDRWKRGDRELLSMYERLESRLDGKDVLLNESGINLHPRFVERLGVFTVYQCFDDIGGGLHPDLTAPAAHAYDLCLTGNAAEVDTYKQAGIRNVEWTPLGLFPGTYDETLTFEAIIAEPRDIDLFMLIDRLSPHFDRPARLQVLAEAFPNAHFYGKGWPRGFLPDGRQLELLRRAKIGPNVHLKTGPLNFRTYQLPANGVMQICDNKSHLRAVFEPGREIVGFDTMAECVDLCRYFLAHDEERRLIAANGWKRAVTQYNEVAVFQSKVNAISRYIGQSLPKAAVAGISRKQRQATRWPRLKHRVPSGVKRVFRPMLVPLKRLVERTLVRFRA